ncbi:hypothetical protein [Acidovorax sp. sic0104]|uniref:hypothetical protein n=1 Tax=Acidovorax sp. sic0104 TaxID=2854784 RepID=UPI001C48B89E|nr:hypothetical protein [Acidovorax sp. sic0104]MBV7544397.1 hypothetical protein [Acidovorax sp. sic0104]
MTNTDELMGWLHNMAERSASELIDHFDEKDRCSLSKLVEQCVPVRLVPDDLNAEEFADWIHGLKASEKEWNRNLGARILKAENLSEGGDRAKGAECLAEFAQECPWLPLREIAQIEAARLRKE